MNTIKFGIYLTLGLAILCIMSCGNKKTISENKNQNEADTTSRWSPPNYNFTHLLYSENKSVPLTDSISGSIIVAVYGESWHDDITTRITIKKDSVCIYQDTSYFYGDDSSLYYAGDPPDIGKKSDSCRQSFFYHLARNIVYPSSKVRNLISALYFEKCESDSTLFHDENSFNKYIASNRIYRDSVGRSMMDSMGLRSVLAGNDTSRDNVVAEENQFIEFIYQGNYTQFAIPNGKYDLKCKLVYYPRLDKMIHIIPE
jgi:hypothetical protein